MHSPIERPPTSFTSRHGLWSAEQERMADEVVRRIEADGLELVRFSFADQHGVLRGKTLIASEAASALRNGVTMTTTLLAKDTAHKTVFPVFTLGGGFGMEEMQGAGDFLMIADPSTFRVLPWAEKTGWVLCDLYFGNGKPVPFSTRAVLRDALGKLAGHGYDFVAGLEVEFHLFKIENARLTAAESTWPPQAPEVSLLCQGYQYLTESRYDMLDEAIAPLRHALDALGLPLRSVEMELGPSQAEFTFRTLPALEAADAMILFRSAAKQIARRHGMLASFMCRPALPNLLSCGWHLHQSLTDRRTAANAFADPDGLSLLARHYMAGLLAHAQGAACFTTPTVNGYKRYRAYTMAPERVIWARDNRGVMVRVMGQPGDPATHLENRIGEPAANPYLYIASQIYSGLDGVARELDPGPSADAPYETKAPGLPKSLREAATALRADEALRAGFGAAFTDYYAHIKEAEYARFAKEADAESAEVTAWEQNEYLDLF